MNKDQISKILQIDKCPTCQEELKFDIEEKSSLVPNIKNGKVDIKHPYVSKSNTAYVVWCTAPKKPLSKKMNQYLEDIANRKISDLSMLSDMASERDLESELEHFKGVFYSEYDYDVVRKLVHRKSVYSTRISVKDNDMIYSCFSRDGSIVAKREKSYVTADNETLTLKIDSLLMLK